MKDQSEQLFHWSSNVNCQNIESFLCNYTILLENEPQWENDQLSYYLYTKEIKKIQKKYGVSTLGEKEEKRLVRLKCDGDTEAFEKLVVSQLPYVINIAKKYQNLGLPLNDLISEGNLGLIEAIKKIEPSYFRVSSYIAPYIRSSICTALNKYSLQIHYPAKIHQNLRKIQKAINKIELQTGFQPSHAEIAAISNLDLDLIEILMTYINHEFSIDKFIQNYGQESFEKLTTEREFIEEEQYNESLKIEVRRALRHLYKREEEILKLILGIDCKELTLEEIGANFNITRERVRQIKENAIIRLKGDKSKLLRQFI